MENEQTGKIGAFSPPFKTFVQKLCMGFCCFRLSVEREGGGGGGFCRLGHRSGGGGGGVLFVDWDHRSDLEECIIRWNKGNV